MLHLSGTIQQPQWIAAVDGQKQSSEKQKKASKQETKRGVKRYEVAISNFTICGNWNTLFHSLWICHTYTLPLEFIKSKLESDQM